MAASAAASTASLAKVCFNSNCKETLERPRKGWRRRTGEFADLCDRCASAYEDGKFCESFHLDASGWRCCESCGKQIHCGCIVSFHMFVLLDAGGIECITCARKSFILTPNPAWPPPSLFLPLQPERIKDISVKNWSPIAGSGPVPWRQAPSLFNGSAIQSELQPRVPTPIEFDVSGGVDRLQLNERLSSSLEKKKKEESFERFMNGSLRICSSEFGSGTSGAMGKEQSFPFSNASPQTGYPSTSDFSVATAPALENGSNNHTKASGTLIQQTTQPTPSEKRPCGHNPADSSEGQPRNGRARPEVRARSQLLPRYWPRITDQELQQISGDSNSVITPLFEKMLSASDAGRIGRLVLPKKCAEAYFPPISQPEGLPLKVQDLKGKEWVFQFRFWPNNNSRMYVLEGITPCIQSMQLQAGDVVTFSRIEPEGKLVMGCRKASCAPSDQGNEASNAGQGYSSNGDVAPKSNKAGEITKPGELVSTNSRMKGYSASSSCPSLNRAAAKSGSTWPELDKRVHVAKVVEAKPAVRSKRKNSTLGLKSKRLRIENEDMLELKVTWEQVQGLLRPPPNKAPSVFVIEGCEIEEYEDAPVIGRPTIPGTDHQGKKIQWAQCEECSKWRKIPADALLPSKWTCSQNLWDPERSLCSTVQELSMEKLQDLLPAISKTASKKIRAPKQDPDSVEALEGLDALANLAIQEKSGSFQASQATTKHPRHKAGCSCIVCIQPPSGKGPKHKQPCDCIVCKSLKRRHKTMMLKKEKNLTEKIPETSDQMLNMQELPEQVPNGLVNKSPKEEVVSDEGCIDNPDEMCSALPFKGQIDLNIQPEKEEELSPSFCSGNIPRSMLETRERHNRQQRLSASSGRGSLVGNQT
ncbi:B3 domain-containing protein Os07g0563300 isoform X2 [Coffea arabica]|uniref:B3 domain-containing protein Os07g0563300 isoform X2 n=1 Tax=Coffea arabica TaxID=13443 RepID=A0A6P6W9H1_COFAR|nr:B3 domain-containing protein Os07g0563300-like isoform X2 [Coffea arabica]